MSSTRLPSKELAEHLLVPYVSTERPLPTLFMDVLAPAHGGPWPPLFFFHGWHQNLLNARPRAKALAQRGFCVLNLNLRGRGGTVGEPDANGWEIRDASDALAAARQIYPQLCSDSQHPRGFGASGGGGNILALVGKCPDLLASAVVWCGVSDYARWFEWNEKGNYRDEMERWIAPNPREHAEAYRSRSGLTVAPNRICPLKIFHGKDDDCVPVEHARAYAEAQKGQPDRDTGAAPFEYVELQGVGHEIPDAPHLKQAAAFLLAHDKPVYVPPRGRWVVAGFLKTHYFEIAWDHAGLVGSIDIDLRRRRLHLDCPSSIAAQVRLAGPVKDPEVLDPAPEGSRIVCVRQHRGWTVLDVLLRKKPLGLRW
ncbi:MAG: prolyl oligopeptidase family serine peptidase [Planctomycetota bacterium]|nr:prolyl oligopeptidase family serine peptidase [Planctomycetota bacterium]